MSEGGSGARRCFPAPRLVPYGAGGVGVGGGTRVLRGLIVWKKIKIKTKHYNLSRFIRDRKKKSFLEKSQNVIKRLQGSHSSIYSIKVLLINLFSVRENLGRVQRCVKIRRFSSRACETYLCF